MWWGSALCTAQHSKPAVKQVPSISVQFPLRPSLPLPLHPSPFPSLPPFLPPFLSPSLQISCLQEQCVSIPSSVLILTENETEKDRWIATLQELHKAAMQHATKMVCGN